MECRVRAEEPVDREFCFFYFEPCPRGYMATWLLGVRAVHDDMMTNNGAIGVSQHGAVGSGLKRYLNSIPES